MRARHGDLERHVAGRSARGFDELDLHRRSEIGPARHAAEQIVSEEGREEIRQAAEVEMPGLEAAAAEAGVPIAVVHELQIIQIREHDRSKRRAYHFQPNGLRVRATVQAPEELALRSHKARMSNRELQESAGPHNKLGELKTF